MKKVLITGASGFIGANLVRHFLTRGYDLFGVVRDVSRSWRISEIKNAFPIYDTDLTNPEATRKIIELIKPEIVLHFAAHVALPHETNEQEIIAHTVYPLINLVSACKEVGSCELFVNAGSSSEYGYQTEPMSETTLPNPTRVHDIAKLTQTLYGVYVAHFKQIPMVSLRLFSVYGPFEAGRRLIPRLMKCTLLNTPLELGSPDISRDFIYIEDVIAAVDHCIGRSGSYHGEVYNLGTGIESTIQDAVRLVQEIHGKEIPVLLGVKPRNQWDSPRWVADTTLQREEFGFIPRLDFRTGLKKTYQWFQEHISQYPEYAAG